MKKITKGALILGACLTAAGVGAGVHAVTKHLPASQEELKKVVDAYMTAEDRYWTPRYLAEGRNTVKFLETEGRVWTTEHCHDWKIRVPGAVDIVKPEQATQLEQSQKEKIDAFLQRVKNNKPLVEEQVRKVIGESGLNLKVGKVLAFTKNVSLEHNLVAPWYRVYLNKPSLAEKFVKKARRAIKGGSNVKQLNQLRQKTFGEKTRAELKQYENKGRGIRRVSRS